MFRYKDEQLRIQKKDIQESIEEFVTEINKKTDFYLTDYYLASIFDDDKNGRSFYINCVLVWKDPQKILDNELSNGFQFFRDVHEKTIFNSGHIQKMDVIKE